MPIVRIIGIFIYNYNPTDLAVKVGLTGYASDNLILKLQDDTAWLNHSTLMKLFLSLILMLHGQLLGATDGLTCYICLF